MSEKQLLEPRRLAPRDRDNEVMRIEGTSGRRVSVTLLQLGKDHPH